MLTRCKVRCISITPVDHGPAGSEGQRAQFQAVYDADPASENGRFFQATPALWMDVGTTHGTPFEAGKEYFLDFAPAEVAAAT